MKFDEEILKEFYDDIYKDALAEEGFAFLTALAARDKYCLPGEAYVMSNRTEMLAREYIEKDDFDIFKAKLHRLVSNDYAYLEKNHKEIPEHLKVVYAGINPINVVDAYSLFLKKLADRNQELIKNPNHKLSAYSIQSLWVSSMQTCPTGRLWYDFDLDVNNIKPEDLADRVIRVVADQFSGKSIKLITTHGGVHMLVKGSEMSKDYNPPVILEVLRAYLDAVCKEINLNKNGLVPCPGTLQGGTLVEYKSLTF